MQSLECPRCKSKNIDNDYSCDVSGTEAFIIEETNAHCVDCGANIIYTRIYRFEEYEDIRLVEE